MPRAPLWEAPPILSRPPTGSSDSDTEGPFCCLPCMDRVGRGWRCLASLLAALARLCWVGLLPRDSHVFGEDRPPSWPPVSTHRMPGETPFAKCNGPHRGWHDWVSCAWLGRLPASSSGDSAGQVPRSHLRATVGWGLLSFVLLFVQGPCSKSWQSAEDDDGS